MLIRQTFHKSDAFIPRRHAKHAFPENSKSQSKKTFHLHLITYKNINYEKSPIKSSSEQTSFHLTRNSQKFSKVPSSLLQIESLHNLKSTFPNQRLLVPIPSYFTSHSIPKSHPALRLSSQRMAFYTTSHFEYTRCRIPHFILHLKRKRISILL